MFDWHNDFREKHCKAKAKLPGYAIVISHLWAQAEEHCWFYAFWWAPSRGFTAKRLVNLILEVYKSALPVWLNWTRWWWRRRRMFEGSINAIDWREWPTEPFQALLSSAMMKKRVQISSVDKQISRASRFFSRANGVRGSFSVSHPLLCILIAQPPTGYRKATATTCLWDSMVVPRTTRCVSRYSFENVFPRSRFNCFCYLIVNKPWCHADCWVDNQILVLSFLDLSSGIGFSMLLECHVEKIRCSKKKAHLKPKFASA